MIRESQIESYHNDEVARLKGETRKVQWINRRGAPDRMTWIPGWHWPKMPEMKKPGKGLEAHQRREHKRLKKMGVECFKLDSYVDVDRFLRTK